MLKKVKQISGINFKRFYHITSAVFLIKGQLRLRIVGRMWSKLEAKDNEAEWSAFMQGIINDKLEAVAREIYKLVGEEYRLLEKELINFYHEWLKASWILQKKRKND